MASMAQRNPAYSTPSRIAEQKASPVDSVAGGLRWQCDRQLDLFWSITIPSIDSLVDPSVHHRFSLTGGRLSLRVMRVRQVAIETGSGLANWQLPTQPDHLIWQWRLAVEADEPSWLVLHHGATDFLQRTLPWAAYGLEYAEFNPAKATVTDWPNPMTLELAFGRLTLQASDAIKRLDSPRTKHWTLNRRTLRRFDWFVDETRVGDAMAVQGQMTFSPSATFPANFNSWLSRPASGQLKLASSNGWSARLGWPTCESGASCRVDWPDNPSSAEKPKR